jgi:hypothetical protein
MSDYFKKIFFYCILTLHSFVFNAQIQKGLDIDGVFAQDQAGRSVSMPDSMTIAVGSPYHDNPPTIATDGIDGGHVRVFFWNGSNWQPKGQEIEGEFGGDRSGQVVSMPDPNTVAIGAHRNDGNGNNSGHVRIYFWNGFTWEQKGADINGAEAGDEFGLSVSMPDANTVAIGAPVRNYVRIYSWNGIEWLQKGGDISNGLPDRCGTSVSMPDPNTVAVGSPLHSGNSITENGLTRIYDWDGSSWLQRGGDIMGDQAEQFLGLRLSMPDANTVAIGSPGTTIPSFIGFVGVYYWDGTVWTQKGNDIIGEAGDYFGTSVSMADSNNIAIGAYLNDANGNNSGQVRIYAWINGSWWQEGADINGENSEDNFGSSVSMPDPNTVASGAPRNNGNGPNSGHVRVYSVCKSTFASDTQSACDNFVWIDGNSYTASNNTATWTIPNAQGCDSIITLDLTMYYSNTGIDTQVACDSYTWIDGNTYTASNNTATWVLNNVIGCDSLITLDLTIFYSNTGTDTKFACDSFTWIDGNTYTSSNNTATWALNNVVGCDSIVTLDLTLGNTFSGTDVVTACDDFTWIDGNTYTSNNNTATSSFINASGCETTMTLDLTILNSNSGVDTQTACDSYTWIDGNTYTSNNNTATWTLSNISGCDSIVTLDLTINSVNDTSVSIDGGTLTANNNLATYQWIDCDDNYDEIAGETSQSFLPAINGNYAVVLTENGCTDTSSCIFINALSIETNNGLLDFNVYPNPTRKELNIAFDTQIENVELRIFNAMGQLVSENTFVNQKLLQVFLPEPNGVYAVELSTEKGKSTFQVLKE